MNVFGNTFEIYSSPNKLRFACSWALSFLHLASIAADNISTCQRVSLLVKLYSLFSERVMFLKRNPKRVLSCFVTMLEFIISTHYLCIRQGCIYV